MTEIPEHLLKRAQARRAAMTGGDAPAADAPAGAASAAAAPAASAAPAKAKAPAPLPTLDSEPVKAKPDLPVVAAAKSRKRVPYWAAPVLLLLPVWGFIYKDAVTPAPRPETDPLVIGDQVFHLTGGCAGCHGADGAGTAGGAQMNDGHVLKTFADPLSMVHWIGYGYKEGAHANGTYGDVNRPQIAGTMPPFKDTLTPKEIAAVTIYIRSTFGGDAYDEANEQGFTKEAFEADPDVLVKEVEDTIALGAGGEPDVASIDRPGAK